MFNHKATMPISAAAGKNRVKVCRPKYFLTFTKIAKDGSLVLTPIADDGR